MPLVGLGVLVLWFGWFGFNAGSTLGAIGGRFAEVAVITNLAAGGVLGALLVSHLRAKTFDIGMAGNGAIAALVAITAPSGYVEYWAAPIIGFVAGGSWSSASSPSTSWSTTPSARSRRTAWPASGARWPAACSPPRGWPSSTGSARAACSTRAPSSSSACRRSGSSPRSPSVFVVSFLVFYAIRASHGLRVSEEEERRGLDIVEHGMWGYPEQFMPVPGSEYHPPNVPGARAGALAMSLSARSQEGRA